MKGTSERERGKGEGKGTGERERGKGERKWIGERDREKGEGEEGGEEGRGYTYFTMRALSTLLKKALGGTMLHLVLSA